MDPDEDNRKTMEEQIEEEVAERARDHFTDIEIERQVYESIPISPWLCDDQGPVSD